MTNAESFNHRLAGSLNRVCMATEGRHAAIRLLVGTILAGVDELLVETRSVRRTPGADWPARLGEVTAQLSLAELRAAGEQLRSALASLEYSADLLGLPHEQRPEAAPRELHHRASVSL